MRKIAKTGFNFVLFRLPGRLQDFAVVIIVWTHNMFAYGITIPKLRILSFFNWIMFGIFGERYTMFRIRRLLKYAMRNTSYYKKSLKNINIDKIRDPADLSKVPILTRKDVLDNFNSLRSRKKLKTYSVLTSGTTGIPAKFLLDREAYAYKFLSWIRAEHKAGCRLWDWSIHVYGDQFLGKKELFTISHHFRKISFSAVDINDANFRVLLDMIRRFKVKHIRSMSSFMYLAADYALRNSIKVKFQTLICDRENLYPFQEKRIKQAFGCRIVRWYSTREGVVSALDTGKGYKFNKDTGIIEICDESGKNVGKGSGQVITTSLINRAMPLIRYQMGDKGVKQGDDISSIDGRIGDILVFNGKSVTPSVLLSVMDKFEGIRDCQFLYNESTLIMRIVKGERFGNSEEILEMLQRVVGNIDIKLEFTDHIKRGSRQKYNPIVRIQ